MKCPYYEIGWCDYALNDKQLSCQPSLCECHSEGETELCQFGFTNALEEEARVSEETQ